jgi:glycerol-3-phosphate acyltransferase PlsX
LEDYIVVALDAMGGDNAPKEIILGAVDALKENSKLKVLLVGKEDIIKQNLSELSYDKDRIEIINATEVIETAEHPVNAINHKKDSSIVVGMKTVRDGKADAFVSAGNSGAVLVGGQLIVGRMKGVKRAPFAPLIPTEKGVSLLLDSGANADCRPEHLLSFAKMGSIYMEYVIGRKNPTVSILSNGAEEGKGNALVKDTYPLLKDCADINFIGNIEARDITAGNSDVIVCDGFVGNAVLKMMEGTAKSLGHVMKKAFYKNLGTKLGALMVKNSLKESLSAFDASEYGGAPLLGLKGLVVKTHGSAKRTEVKNSLLQCITFKEQDISGKLTEKLSV